MEMTSSVVARQYASSRDATRPEAGSGNGLVNAATEFAATMAEGERTAMAAMRGGADSHSLVQALAQTELAVEAVVTVRNKVVEAYQEILRMPV